MMLKNTYTLNRIYNDNDKEDRCRMLNANIRGYASQCAKSDESADVPFRNADNETTQAQLNIRPNGDVTLYDPQGLDDIVTYNVDNHHMFEYDFKDTDEISNARFHMDYVRYYRSFIDILVDRKTRLDIHADWMNLGHDVMYKADEYHLVPLVDDIYNTYYGHSSQLIGRAISYVINIAQNPTVDNPVQLFGRFAHMYVEHPERLEVGSKAQFTIINGFRRWFNQNPEKGSMDIVVEWDKVNQAMLARV